jgi:group II intron reverse transcriptase/maturase
MPNSKDIFTLEELMKSWKKVKTKSGSNLNDSINGLEDEVSVKEYLQEILDELVEGKYVPDPVRQYIRVRSDSGKEQKISILTFRDKIVQQTLVNYLQPLFEPQFLDCSYAYRQGRSALLAADQIQTLIHGGNTWVLETDIASFFDTMNHEILIDRLKEKVDDLHVINLINAYLKSPHFCEMSFYSAEEGVSIGGIISPLLSNIYLHELDQDMIKGGYTYIRYSDDLIVLGTLKEEMRQALFLITTVLKKLNLNINKSKTAIRHVSEGFVFLGFRFDDKGRGPAVKAIEALKQNIDIVNKRNLLATERLTELETVLQGWSNYYNSITWLAPADFSTLVALISRAAADNNQEWAHKLLEQKDLLVDGTPELHLLLARKLVNLGLIDEALTEYGYALADETLQKEAKIEIAALLPVGSDTLEQICEQLVLLSAEPRCAATYHVLSELYLAAGLYSQAQSAHSRAAELESREAKTAEDALISAGSPDDVHKVLLTAAEKDLYLKLFSGRDDVYAIETLSSGRERLFTNKKSSISVDELDRHLAGEITLVVYIIRENHTVKFMLIDIDVSKKLLLEKEEQGEALNELIKLTQVDANRIKSAATEMGLTVYIEDSGYRGRHCWFFFEQPVKARDARIMAKAIMRKAGDVTGGVTWELFPGTDRLKNTQISQRIKLPLGVHPKSGRRGLFVDEMGLQLDNQGEYLQNIQPLTAVQVEQIVATEEKRSKKGDLNLQPADSLAERSSLLIEQADSVLVKAVINKCALIKYLILMAEDTKYLTHQDRLTLLHVLAHLGDNGKAYLHRVMACCINYNQGITQKHIDRLPGKPISCSRLREKYPELTASMNCNCYFKLLPKNYPSPVLHAISIDKQKQINHPLVADDDLSASCSPEAEQVEATLKKMQNLRRQQQGIENAMQKYEQQLLAIFQNLETDRIAIGAGTLVCKQLKDKIKWVIEI